MFINVFSKCLNEPLQKLVFGAFYTNVYINICNTNSVRRPLKISRSYEDKSVISLWIVVMESVNQSKVDLGCH